MKGLNQIIKSESGDADLVVTNLPDMPPGAISFVISGGRAGKSISFAASLMNFSDIMISTQPSNKEVPKIQTGEQEKEGSPSGG